MSGVRRGCACGLALIGASFILPAAVAAHGGASAIVRVAALDDQRAPWLLQLDKGLALRTEDGWRFVCPDEVEASTILHAISADAHTAWVVTLRGLYRLSQDGAVMRVDNTCRGYPLELVRHQERAYLLAQDTAQGEHIICALEEDGARELYASQIPIADLASDGERLWLTRQYAAADSSGIELAALSDDEPGAWQSYSLSEAPRAVRLFAAGGELYATLIGNGRHALVRLVEQRAVHWLDSATAIKGPVDTEEGPFALADGGLFALVPFAERVETPLEVDGLDGAEGRGFAFSRGALYDLPMAGDAIVTLDDLAPPVSLSSACEVQWQGFLRGLHGADHAALALAQSADAEPAGAPAPQEHNTEDAGCSAAPSRSSSTPAARGFGGLILAAILLRRRRFRGR